MSIIPKSVEFHQCHAKPHSGDLFFITKTKITKEIFCKIAQNNTKNNVWEKSNDAYLLSIRIQTAINHISIACVASVPVRAERNIGPREAIFAFRTCGKWGEISFSARPECKNSLAVLYFVRLVREGLLRKQYFDFYFFKFFYDNINVKEIVFFQSAS